MTQENDLHWIVKEGGPSPLFSCPECYKSEGKYPVMRIPIRLLDNDRQCPGCSITVERWEKSVGIKEIKNTNSWKPLFNK